MCLLCISSGFSSFWFPAVSSPFTATSRILIYRNQDIVWFIYSDPLKIKPIYEEGLKVIQFLLIINIVL